MAFTSLAWNGCGSNEPTNVLIVYDVSYSLEIVGNQSKVTSIHWTAANGTETEVTNPPSGWRLQMLAFSGDLIGLRAVGSASNGEFRISLSATSPGVTGITGTDSCSDDTGILRACSLMLPQTVLP